MMTILLILIYLAFISLGLPDSLLGSSWPTMSVALGLPLSAAGILSLLVTGGTIISSALSARMIRRFGTGAITAVSVGMTALALLGISVAPGFIWLCLLAIPLGLGAGTVDAALNNFVALRYKAIHLNWLHCFWGIGATLGPLIISLTLMLPDGWRTGYRRIGFIQIALVFVLVAALPLWRRVSQAEQETGAEPYRVLSIKDIIRLPLAKSTLFTFFFYCALESTTGLWSSSYLVHVRGLDAEVAARWTSMFYFGITAGRFIAGLVSIKVKNQNLIRLGLCLITMGVICMVTGPTIFCLIGLILIGVGCAPVFPGLIHDTPQRFGRENAQAVMGIQMACAYIGATTIPPLFGLLAQAVSLKLLSVLQFACAVGMILLSENVNKRRKMENSNA